MHFADGRPDELDLLFRSLRWLQPPSGFRRSTLAHARATRARDDARRRWIALDLVVLAAFGIAVDVLTRNVYSQRLPRWPLQLQYLTNDVGFPPVIAVLVFAALAVIVTRRVRQLFLEPVP